MARSGAAILTGATETCDDRAQTVYIYGMLRILLPVICLLLWSAHPAHEAEIIRPKVLVVATYETGQDRGDIPGELQYHESRSGDGYGVTSGMAFSTHQARRVSGEWGDTISLTASFWKCR